MSKAKELEKLKAEALQCQLCELRSGCSQVVFGEGSPEAGIMLIGEGPGREEDKIGKPFVGRAGQLLDKILEACGFERSKHVYIANIVKCRPPQNRVPAPLERAACKPYLLKQIEIIEPRIIILLGATALQGFLDPQAKISQMRGQWQTWQNIQVMPTYHPAALLRNPGLKRPTWEDFKKVVSKYRELVDKEHVSPHC